MLGIRTVMVLLSDWLHVCSETVICLLSDWLHVGYENCYVCFQTGYMFGIRTVICLLSDWLHVWYENCYGFAFRLVTCL
mgnify:CR=1 FL=1